MSDDTRRPTPPYPAQHQEPPGNTASMQPIPDHGEHSYKGNGRLEGKVALITGADSGIGKAVAIAFAREGADILISYLNEDEDAKDTAKGVEEAGRKAVVVSGDIKSEKHCNTLVRVNAVAPGPIWTPLIPSTMPGEKAAKFGENTLIGRAGQPAELAGAYVLLASDLGSYMTGAVIPVTGGEIMI